MDYENVNGYKITPYDVNGVQCWAIRDGKIGCLIRNYKRIALIVAQKGLAIEIANTAPHCTKIVNFTVEGVV